MRRFASSLSGRLLAVTLVSVMLVEVAIFVPSVSRFRMEYLEERAVRARLAAIAILAAPDEILPPIYEADLLSEAGVTSVAIRRNGRREQLIGPGEQEFVSGVHDIREMNPIPLIRNALARLVWTEPGEVIAVIASTPKVQGEAIEITLEARPLQEALRDYAWRILQLSLVISGLTAAVVFVVVRAVVVAPVSRVVRSIKRFQEAPQDPARVIEPRSRMGELAEAERALADMQHDVRRALSERERLASLGEALAKVSHDLRNMLATGTLVADRLETSSDPVVRRLAPKLIGALDRAVTLCQSTLDYGRASEPAPRPRAVRLAPLCEELNTSLGLEDGSDVTLELDLPADYRLVADPDQLFRVLLNLTKNAVEAIRGAGREGRIRIAAEDAETFYLIRVADDGPGMPRKAVEHLFRAFQGGQRKGGTGLGLAISQELVRGHGGDLMLVRTDETGTEFLVTIPRRETGLRAVESA